MLAPFHKNDAVIYGDYGDTTKSQPVYQKKKRLRCSLFSPSIIPIPFKGIRLGQVSNRVLHRKSCQLLSTAC